jgi:hypothetical protein
LTTVARASRKIIGTTPNRISVPKSTNPSGRPLMVELSLATAAPPRATFSMPSVTMNDGTRHRSEMQPLSSPATSPASRQAPRAIGTASQRGLDGSIRTWAPNTVPSARTDPTDRSMPPTRMTKVIPTASTVLIDTCTRMFRTLAGLAKRSATSAKTRHTRTSAIPMPASRSENDAIR